MQSKAGVASQARKKPDQMRSQQRDTEQQDLQSIPMLSSPSTCLFAVRFRWFRAKNNIVHFPQIAKNKFPFLSGGNNPTPP
jgi:hypothetical protein